MTKKSIIRLVRDGLVPPREVPGILASKLVASATTLAGLRVVADESVPAGTVLVVDEGNHVLGILKSVGAPAEVAAPAPVRHGCGVLEPVDLQPPVPPELERLQKKFVVVP